MNFRDKKGSITIFVLVGLLFMSSFLIISFGSNINKSKTAKEQFDILSGIYSHGDGDASAYKRAYTVIRKRNAQTLTYDSEEQGLTSVSTVELTKTFNDKISDYKIYGNSVQNGTPSPTNPVEIESVGNLTKNLFCLHGREVKDFGEKSNTTKRVFSGNGIFLGLAANNYYSGQGVIKDYSINEDNNKVIFTGTSDFYGIGFDFQAKENTTYTISSSNKDELIGIIEYSEDGNYITFSRAKGQLTCTTKEQTKWIVILLNNSNSNTELIFNNIQLEEGTVATEYEPYGKYKIPVKVSGKNLFNINVITHSGITINGNEFTMSSAFTNGSPIGLLSDLCPNLKVGDTFVINFETNAIRDNKLVNYVYLNVYKKSLEIKTKYVCTQEMLDSQVFCYRGTTENAYIKKFQVEIGSTATEFEPYIEPITTNIYLDEPLRKVENYKDYIDFENKILYRIIKKGQINGSSKFLKFGNVTNYSAFYMEQSDMINYETSGLMNVPVLSNKFIYHKCGGANINNSWSGNYQIGGSVYSTYNRICFTLPNTITDVTSAVNWFSNNPVDYYYPMLDPIVQTIELPELNTYEDYTRIEVLTEVAPSKIELTYDGYTME